MEVRLAPAQHLVDQQGFTLFRFILDCMKSSHRASAQARNQRRDGRTGRFVPENKPATTAPLDEQKACGPGW